MFSRQLFSLIGLMIICSSVDSQRVQRLIYNEQPKGADSLEIHEGILCQHATKIKYKRKGKKVVTIELSEPLMITMADREEPWGFYHFPNIGKTLDGTLIVSWSMQEDSYKKNGVPGRKFVPMMSKDNGVTWMPRDKEYFTLIHGYNGMMKDGRLLQIHTPTTKDIKSYENFPKAIEVRGNQSYFLIDDLPEDLQGTYLRYHQESKPALLFHAKVDDPGALRIANGNLMPFVWWGTVKELADNSLIAGVYPCIYKEKNGKITNSSVSFFRSVDEGATWKVTGRIPCVADGILDKRGDCKFDEPTFEILKDSTLLCVMRSGSTSPMYKTYSYDMGDNWSKPIPFTPNGVNPRLMLLNNGILVLASGRPGVQIRFSFDGRGCEWSEPIDMIPFMQQNGTYIRDVSCGYVSMMEADQDSFYMVYSDFTTKNAKNQKRKSIWFRKVIIKM